MSEQDSKTDLDWVAFCYLAGELNPAESAEFDVRLADEQAAREALARAVEMTQVVAAAESQGREVVLAERSRDSWGSRASWMAIGGLASVLVALLWSGVPSPPVRTTLTRGMAEKQVALAAAWTEARDEIASVKDAGLWPLTATSAADFDEDFLVMTDLAAEDLAFEDAPSWMTTAVFSLSGRSLEDGPEQLSNERGEN
jgi:hypothetical protein